MTATAYQQRPGPGHNRSRVTFQDLADHLQENPGQWYMVRKAATQNAAATHAYQIRTGRRAAFQPAGHYDAYSTGTEVIAQYTGGN